MFNFRSKQASLTVVVVAYQMQRELPRTLFSIASGYQDWSGVKGKVVIIDNASVPPVKQYDFSNFSVKVPVSIRQMNVGPSPLSAVNEVIAEAETDWLCVVLDGARMWSPGVIQRFRESTSRFPNVPNGPMAWHLGEVHQSFAATVGYDQDVEDQNLDRIDWCSNGYRLFTVSCLAGANPNGFFGSLNEATALFLTRKQWISLEGFNLRFNSAGGGYGCLDLFQRLMDTTKNRFVVHLGEGTFHQIHGGISTSASGPHEQWGAEYLEIVGRPYQSPKVEIDYVGSISEFSKQYA